MRPLVSLSWLSLMPLTMMLGGCATTGASPRPFPTPEPRSAGAAEAAPAPGTPADPERSTAPALEASPAPAPNTGPAHSGSPTWASAAAVDAVAHRIVQSALGLVGTRYRAGGTTPEAGFDCSGFVSWVYRSAGMAVPRTVSDQFEVGAHLDAAMVEDLRPGDLVFFDTERGSQPDHVAVALGDGRFVHAPNRRGVVRVEPLSDDYWSRRFVGARRLLVEPAPPTR